MSVRSWSGYAAKLAVGDWIERVYNHRHRHSALGYLTPAEYPAHCTHTHHPVACEIN